jgi:hypothetical protein
MKQRIILAILLIVNTLSYAQKEAGSIAEADLSRLARLEDSIAAFAKVAVQDTIPENRITANERLLTTLRTFLAVPNSFNYAFSKVENISILQPQDKSFRIMSWQLFKDYNHYHYFGIVQLNRYKSTFYELLDHSRSLRKPEKDLLTHDNWFGALYYNLKEFKTKEGTRYLLFGFNANDEIEKIKVCDVMILRGGAPRFGAPVFEVADIKGKKKEKFHRLVLTYSADAVLRLNYDEQLRAIVHDHLQPVASTNPEVPFVYVPDGTYELFEYDKGIWQHVDKLPNQVLDEAPRPAAKLNSRNRVKSAKENAKQVEWPEEVTKKKNN